VADWEFSPATEQVLVGILRKLGVRTATAVIKTWTNTWTTSSRMHEIDRMSCIFGCEAEDCLDHYLCCDPLWTAVISNSFRRVELLWSRPLTKIGLVDPSIEWLQMLAIAFACYHSMKIDHKNDISLLLEGGHPCQVHFRLMHYARAHFREIVGDR